MCLKALYFRSIVFRTKIKELFNSIAKRKWSIYKAVSCQHRTWVVFVSIHSLMRSSGEDFFSFLPDATRQRSL